MTLTLATSLLISGAVLGSVSLTMALGLTLVYGVTRVFNFAQGSFYIWAGYIVFVLQRGTELPYSLIIAICIVSMFGIGLLFERVMIYPLRRLAEWRWTAVIVTLGAALFLDSLSTYLFGTKARTFPPIVEGVFEYGIASITGQDLLIILVTIAVIFILNLFLRKVRTGMGMQAVAQDAVGANIVGIPINRMYGYSFALAGLLAGISAVLLVPRLPLFPLIGWTVFVKAFTVLMFGGLGSIKGATIAAYILALIEVFAIHRFGAVWALPIYLIVLIIVLVFRPKGLFGVW